MREEMFIYVSLLGLQDGQDRTLAGISWHKLWPRAVLIRQSFECGWYIDLKITRVCALCLKQGQQVRRDLAAILSASTWRIETSRLLLEIPYPAGMKEKEPMCQIKRKYIAHQEKTKTFFQCGDEFSVSLGKWSVPQFHVGKSVRLISP